MSVGIIKTAWAGTSGGPGLTQLAIREPSGTFATDASVQSCVNAVRAFWNAIVAQLPNEITLTVQPTVDWYRESDGELIGSITAPTAPASVAGQDASNFSMASGYKCNLQTGVIRDGRRVRGSIYVVPAALSVFSTSGTIGSGPRGTTNTALATLKGSLNGSGLEWCVWSRERQATADKPYRAGATAPVTIAEVNEKVAVLRGRRD